VSHLVVRFLLLGYGLLLSNWGYAQSPSAKLCQAPCSAERPWELSVGIGLGVSINPLKGGDDIPLLVRPKFSYYGERFFIDNLEAGFTLWESPVQQFNLLLLPSLEQLYFRRWQYSTLRLPPKSEATGSDRPSITEPSLGAFSNMHHRHTSALGGIEYIYTFEGFDFNLQVLDELSGYHAGRELRLALSYDFSEHWRLSLGADYQTQAYLNYFYGVYASEANNDFAHYAPDGGGWSELLRLEYTKPINEHFAIKASAAIKEFPTQISSSPLIEEPRVYSVFVGGVYSF
jgi:MipA family protein